jgi:hypothetical protein
MLAADGIPRIELLYFEKLTSGLRFYSIYQWENCDFRADFQQQGG